ncbi:MAG: recombinase family protein [Planctomycetota bacterium]
MSGRVWGYARVSDPSKQDESADVQIQRIKARADEIAAEAGELVWIAHEAESAKEVPFDKRQEYRKLMQLMQPGDTLICWQLSRIDRHPFRLVRAIEWLMNHEIRLITLREMGGRMFDLTSAYGRAMILMGAIWNDIWMEHHQEATRSAVRALRAAGEVYTPHVPFGKRRRTLSIRKWSRKPKKVDVWDVDECRLLIEWVLRHRNGESYERIIRECAVKELKRTNGQLWSRLHRGKCGKENRYTGDRVRRAIQWAERELAERGCIGPVRIDDVLPGLHRQWFGESPEGTIERVESNAPRQAASA